MSPQLLDINSVSELLSISKSTIRRMIDRGEFPAPVQISERIHRWHESTITTWARRVRDPIKYKTKDIRKVETK